MQMDLNKIKQHGRAITVIALVVIVSVVAVFADQTISAKDNSSGEPPASIGPPEPAKQVLNNVFTSFDQFQKGQVQTGLNTLTTNTQAQPQALETLAVLTVTGTKEKDSNRKMVLLDGTDKKVFCDQLSPQGFLGGSSEQAVWNELQPSLQDLIKNACTQL